MRQRSGTGTCSTGGRVRGGPRKPAKPSGSSVTGTGGCGSGAAGGGGSSGGGRRRGVRGRASSPSPSDRPPARGPDVSSAPATVVQSRTRLANVAYRIRTCSLVHPPANDGENFPGESAAGQTPSLHASSRLTTDSPGARPERSP